MGLCPGNQPTGSASAKPCFSSSHLRQFLGPLHRHSKRLITNSIIYPRSVDTWCLHCLAIKSFTEHWLHGVERSSDFFDPVALAAQYPDLDERALQLLEAPNARYGDRGRVLSSMQPGNVGDRFNQQHTVLTPSKL